MKIRRKLFLPVVVCCGLMFSIVVSGGLAAQIPIFEDPSYSFEERAADLVARLTPAQKGTQMISSAPAIPANQLGGGALNVPATMGISQYQWWSEALHGYARGTGSTNAVSYPQNLSVASTWNRELYYRQASMIADEIRELTRKVESGSNAGNALDLTFYSPTINMQRDPRWGRNEESYSEDPFLMAAMASQFVLGMEGKYQDGSPIDEKGRLKTVTTLKHYTANNSERNRLDGGADNVDLRALREYYTAPYRDVIKTADVASVMTAYSTLNGEPCTMSSYLLDTLLRQTWGFNGYITSDCDSVSTIARHKYVNPHTGAVLTPVEQLAQAMAHGTDLECSGGYSSNVGTYASRITAMLAEAPATDKGVFTEHQVDISLHRLFTARMKLGEFDRDLPFTIEAQARIDAYKEANPESDLYWQTPERLALAEEVATEAVVVLQNSNNLLPLNISDKASFKVAIVGEWQVNTYLGLYSSQQNNLTNHVNIQQGITDALKSQNENVEFTYITENNLTDDHIAAIASADVAIVVAGTGHSYSAEDRDRTTIALPDNQAELISQVGRLNANTIVVLETCGPVQVSTFQNDVDAILWSSYGGMRKGVGFGRIIAGFANPSGKLTSTWHINVNDTGESDLAEITDYNLYKTAGSPGRTYMYFDEEVSYPFGYGLSFTEYTYSNIKVMKNGVETTSFDANDTITVIFDVENTGSVAGQEVVQLYAAQPDVPAELQRPIKRLKAFDKIALEPGEKKTVALDVKIADLAYYSEEDDRYLVDTGVYEIQIGASSADIRLTSLIEVSGALRVVPTVLAAKPVQEGDAGKGIEERLIFEKGKIVHPQLTVAMNDESLYGYIIANQKSPIISKHSVSYPEGMTFTFESNRPEVVAVNGDQIITVAPGVATITATATYNGESVSTDFVVYVASTSYVDGILVDGELIPDFRDTTLNYQVELASGDPIPQIDAVSDNEDLIITVTQADHVPGVATIESYNTYSGETLIYRVGFGMVPEPTRFADGLDAAMAAGWAFINGNENVECSEKGLTIIAEQGAFGTEIPPKNIFAQPALGDWVIQTKVELSERISENGQQAGLIVYDDDQNYITYALERVTRFSWWGAISSNVLRVNCVAAGYASEIGSVNMETDSIYLQIVKQGNVYSFRYSENGEDWSAFADRANINLALSQIGMWANKGLEATIDFTATFDGIDVFEVAELYPRLAEISIDGETLGNFEPDQFAYNFEITEEATNVPVIDATPAHEHHLVTIEQLAKPAGQAVIKVASGAEAVTYTVNYNYAPVSDYFADGTISERWEILKEDTSAYRLVPGMGIEMPTQAGDIYSTGGSWHNVFVMPAMGNWEVVAKVFYPHKPKANYQQAMLLVWQGEDNYIRLNCQQEALRIEPGVELNGAFGGHGLSQAFAEASEDGTVTIYFRIEKSGLTYHAAFSQDGLNYTSLGTVENIDFANPKIGLFAAQNSSAEPMHVYWEYLTLTSYNGVVQRTYAEMLQDAVQNVLEYIVKEIPPEIRDDIEIAVPHGYSVVFSSSDPGVIASDGSVTPQDKRVDLTVTVSDGVRSATSEVISVKVLPLS